MQTKIKQTNLSLLTSQSSTVQQLYAKFQNLKQRITNTDSKRSSRSIDRKYGQESKQRDNKHRRIGMVQPLPLSVYVGMRNQSKLEKKQNVSCQNVRICWEQERKVLGQKVLIMINQVQQRYTGLLTQLTRKLSTLQSKLLIAQGIIRQRRIQDNMIKVDSSFIENVNNTTCCHTFKSFSQNTIENYCLNLSNGKQDSVSKGFLIRQMQKRHKEQIKQIVQQYQQRISKILGKHDKHNKDFIVTNNSIRNHKEENPLALNRQKSSTTIQQLLLQKEKHINELQIENKKLKKMLQQSKINYERNLEINKIIKDQNKILQQAVCRLQGWKRQSEIERKCLDSEIDKLRQQIKSKMIQIKQLRENNQNLLTQLNSYYTNTNNQTKNSKDTGSTQTIQLLHHNFLQLNNKKSTTKFITTQTREKQINQQNQHQQQQQIQRSYQLQTVLTDRSQILDEINQKQEKKHSQEIIQLQLLQMAQIQKIKHSRSLVLLNRLAGIDNVILNKRKQKQLLDEIHLLEQQNRLLKSKKDKFQAEIFKAENDQDMMQQQLTRLNQQIRRLNTLWHYLDQCAVKLFKGQQLKQEKIVVLQKQSKLRQEYYKKRQTKKRGFSLRR